MVVERLHPSWLQAYYVYRKAELLEPRGLVDELELVHVLVADVREAECERRQQLRPAGEARVRVEELAVAAPDEHVEVEVPDRNPAIHGVGIRLADVEPVLPRRVHEHAPSAARHGHRHRDVAVHVLHEYLVPSRPALDVAAVDVAKAEHSLAGCKREPGRAAVLCERCLHRKIRPGDARAHPHLAVIPGRDLQRLRGRPAVADFEARAVPFQPTHDPVAVHAAFGPDLARSAPHANDVRRHHVDAQPRAVDKLRHEGSLPGLVGIPPHGARQRGVSGRGAGAQGGERGDCRSVRHQSPLPPNLSMPNIARLVLTRIVSDEPE